jgi:hypothetical protein
MSLTVATVVLLAGLLVFVPVGAKWTRTQGMIVGRRAALWVMLGAFLSAWRRPWRGRECGPGCPGCCACPLTCSWR